MRFVFLIFLCSCASVNVPKPEPVLIDYGYYKEQPEEKPEQTETKWWAVMSFFLFTAIIFN